MTIPNFYFSWKAFEAGGEGQKQIEKTENVFAWLNPLSAPTYGSKWNNVFVYRMKTFEIFYAIKLKNATFMVFRKDYNILIFQIPKKKNFLKIANE